MAADRRRLVGASGEDAAAAWYADEGYEVVARNWRVRTGEIDIVARRGSTLVFCEVKTRRGNAFGVPAEAVTTDKQRRIRRLAAEYLSTHAGAGEIRFDVAAVTASGDGWDIDVLEAAF
ncbi:MAG: YraN family protein [Actinomycetota bacterium]